MTRKALSLREFTELPEELQLEVLHKHGVYVGKRKVSGQFIILFQLHGFYVELYYSEYRKSVDRIMTSNHPEILHPYLDQIIVKDLGK